MKTFICSLILSGFLPFLLCGCTEEEAMMMGILGTGFQTAPNMTASDRALGAMMQTGSQAQLNSVNARQSSSQVNVYANNPTAQTSISQPSIWHAKDQKMSNGSLYTGPMVRDVDGNWQASGQGTSILSDGSKYEGTFQKGNFNGFGVMTASTGAKYEGEWKNGQMDGFGILTLIDGCKYEGHFKNHLKNGKGVFTLPNGERVEGQWKDDEISGSVIYTWPCGQKYEGELKDGKRHGRGVLTLNDGAKYEGDFMDDKYHGRGVYISSDGKKYEGDFEADKYHGRGVLILNDGTKYEGDFEADKFHGRGVYISSDGAKYEGDFMDHKVHGHGVVVKPDGTKISGEWKDNKAWKTKGVEIWPDGTRFEGEWNWDGSKSGGTIDWKDGRRYVGQWKIVEGEQDLPDGEGTMTWTDGGQYIGDFKEGNKHGYGKMVYADGRTEEGAWRDDTFVGGQAQTNVEKSKNQVGNSKLGAVNITADDDSYEVYVNSVFVGNIPAKLQLPEGKHTIEVKKIGYKDYIREIHVTHGAELNLRVSLEINE